MIKNHSAVLCVQPGSIAEEAGIEQGDVIQSINDKIIRDIFDYRFFAANEKLALVVQKKNCDVWDIDIEKDEYEDLGIEFESPLMDEVKSCRNKCIFCFIDQLPKGMRDTLYFKDDDSRLSFLTGNYITLTNASYDEIDRIIEYKMSPVNVSVHTANPDLRVFMLKNKSAWDVMTKIKRLVNGGITVNCQIVICRGVNDGKELDDTISSLTVLYPGVNSVSVVPAGVTKYRENLYNLQPFDKRYLHSLILQIEGWQKRLMDKHGVRVVYPADELYIIAGLDMPDYNCYDDFPQIENGVGLIALLRHEFNEYVGKNSCNLRSLRTISIATGVSSFKFIKEMAEALEAKCNNLLKIYVYEIRNVFFGENVTVTGLLTGGDIASQLEGKELGDELLIPANMLKSGEDLFLDDYTIDMLKEKLNVDICSVENSGKDLIEKVLGGGVFFGKTNSCSSGKA